MENHFDRLPKELNEIILYYINDVKDLYAVVLFVRAQEGSHNHHLLDDILNDDYFWQQKYICNFPLLDPHLIINDYKKYYTVKGAIKKLYNYRVFKHYYRITNHAFENQYKKGTIITFPLTKLTDSKINISDDILAEIFNNGSVSSPPYCSLGKIFINIDKPIYIGPVEDRVVFWLILDNKF